MEFGHDDMLMPGTSSPLETVHTMLCKQQHAEQACDCKSDVVHTERRLLYFAISCICVLRLSPEYALNRSVCFARASFMYFRCRPCTSLVLVVQSVASFSHAFSVSLRQPTGFQSGLPAWYRAVDPQLVVSDATISAGATRPQLLVAELLFFVQAAQHLLLILCTKFTRRPQHDRYAAS